MSKELITVELLVKKDYPDWLALWKEWQAHMNGAVPHHISDKTWALMMDKQSGLFGLIARNRRGVAIGFAHVSTMPFAWTASKVLYLQDLFVRETVRSSGVGAALVKAIYALADERGADQVFWMVDEGNLRLQAFYQRHAIRTPYLRYMRKPWPW
jgi:GNAT superfamily N-acetyltransferase